MKVTLIRHAESESNVGGTTTAPASIKLTLKGISESISFADSIVEKPDLIIVTPYLRTRQTAYPLIEKYPMVEVQEWPLHEFTFLSPTECRNTTVDERKPLVAAYWQKCYPDFVHGEGAESFNQFSGRIQLCLESLKKLNNSRILIFTHGLTIKLILQYQRNPNDLSIVTFRDKVLPMVIPNLFAFELNMS